VIIAASKVPTRNFNVAKASKPAKRFLKGVSFAKKKKKKKNQNQKDQAIYMGDTNIANFAYSNYKFSIEN